MSRLHYVPVFEFDPNTPGRDLGDFGHTIAAYAGVRNADMAEDLRDGTYGVGDLAFAYQPHEGESSKYEDAGIGFPCRIVKVVDCSDTETANFFLVYLEIDPAYAIVDRRRNDNDEGT